MNLPKDINELLEAGVIDTSTADRIAAYYQAKSSNSGNRLFLVFGILGALLIGLGVILILAHNWDNLSRGVKTVFAFLPLLIAQGLCAFTLLRKEDSDTWRESTATLLFFGVGASIALISQIYNMPGQLETFLLTWAVLVLPIIYIMRSSMVSLLYLAGITWYACLTGYDYGGSFWNYYWLLLLAVLPFYYMENQRRPNSNALAFHHWMIPISLTITLGIFADRYDEWMFVAYMSLMGLFYQIGNTSAFQGKRLLRNAYRVIGALGTIAILLVLSFSWFWKDLVREANDWMGIFYSQEMYLSIALTLITGVLAFRNVSRAKWRRIEPLTPVFLVFFILFLIGTQTSIVTLLINLLVLVVGVLIIRKGGQEDHLGVLNFGLLVVSALIFARFFDANLSFVLRGLLFVLLGVGFFFVNYRMLQKRKANEV